MPASEYSKDMDRTTDVLTQYETPFSSIIGDNPKLLQGLTDCNFMFASPIQVNALRPIIDGTDTIVEAKNGTGKTLTFVIPTLMKLKVELNHLQAIVLAPTREIAVQIQQCFKQVGQHMLNLKCEYFIGGTPFNTDKQKADGCQIAVGSPGRIKHLIDEHVLKGSEVKIFILDEVDRLFTDTNFTKDVRLIDAKLPKLKQMIFVSASIDEKSKKIFGELMNRYVVARGINEDMNASEDPSKFLLGIKQYVACVKAVSTNIILLPAKNVRLLNILRNLDFTQCIIFTNYMTRVEAVCNMLRDHKYKADYIRGDQDQNIRLKLVDRLRSFKSKILVATDLIARGIDSSNVDLVINMDCPNDWATYLHRIGRAGRFGNKGNSITILDDDKELKSFKCIINSIESVKIKILPIAITKPILEYDDAELEDLNLIIESDVLTNNQNGIIEAKTIDNNTTMVTQEENNGPSCLELNPNNIEYDINNLSKAPQSEIKIESVHGLDKSKEESLEKLCELVKETEKELVDKNHLPMDRTFVLFDPEPYLDDVDQFKKYSPLELVDIITNYNSDVNKYETAKKSVVNKCILLNDCEKLFSENPQVFQDNDSSINFIDNILINSIDNMLIDNIDNKVSNTNVDQQPLGKNTPLNNSEENPSSNNVSLERNSLNESNNSNKIKINENTKQRPQFTNIYDLFQIPDFSLLKPACPDDSNFHLINEKENYNSKACKTDIVQLENSDEVEWTGEKDHPLETELGDEEEDEEEESFSNDVDDESNEYDSFDEDVEEDSNNESYENDSIDENTEEESNYESNEDDSIEEDIENESINENKEDNSIDNDIEYGITDEDIKDEGNNCAQGHNYEKYSAKFNDSIQRSFNSPNKEKNVMLLQASRENINNDKQLVNYDYMNEWYGQWRKQLKIIQKCAGLSKQ